MSDPNLFRLRVTYVKQGRLALLSQLEIARALERTVRRAGLPYAVTQGFSPHMKISFGAALPVGVGGTDEFFDLMLTSYVAPETALKALAGASASDLMCKTCAYVRPSEKAASVAKPVSVYRAQLSSAVEMLPVPRVVNIERKGKVKERIVSEFLMGDVVLEGSTVTFALKAKLDGSLRPDVFLQECIKLYQAMVSGEACVDIVNDVLKCVKNTASRTCEDVSLHVVSCTRIEQMEER